MGCSAITLRKLEAEARRPSTQIAERLADVLQVPPDDRPAFLRFARGDPFAAPAASKIPDPSSPPPAPQHNLPLQLTSFIGREKEVAEIRQLLGGNARLLTLTGPGGTGKTRLALQVAAELLDEFADGVWLVDLAPLADPALVPQTVAAVLGVKEEPDRPLLATLAGHLSGKRALLILDNCEHLIQACAELTDKVLRACPRLILLATSREALGIAGEREYLVPALSLPDPRPIQSAEALTQSEAVRLFLDRASTALPGFALTGDNAAAVAHVCRQLDGIPLAIELAAARVKILRAEEIAARLTDRFQLLTGGSRAVLPRHQTLQALIDWSYDLLSAPERLLLQRLAVFVGGWTLEAAEAVCAGDGVESSEVLGLLAQLANKSLVLTERKPSTATRYRMLETIRQYALGRLENGGDADEVRQRHAAYYLALAEVGAPSPPLTSQPAWRDPIALELDNLRAALGWSQLTPSRVELALRLTSVFAAFWNSHGYGYIREGRGWLDSVITQPEAANYPTAQAQAIMDRGTALAVLVGFQAAEADFAESLRLFQASGDRRNGAAALERLGWAARERGDAATACARLEESLALCRELGDPSRICGVTNTLAEAMILQGDIVKAKALLEDNLAQARQMADPMLMGWALNHLGHIAQMEGEYEQAIKLHEASLPVFHQVAARNIGHIWAHQSLGETTLAQGDAREAASHFAEALVPSQDRGIREVMAWCLAGLGGAAALDEEPERAAWLWGAAEALRQSIGAREAPASHATHERLKAQAREQLGQAAFAAQWAAGEAASLSAAIELALHSEAEA